MGSWIGAEAAHGPLDGLQVSASVWVCAVACPAFHECGCARGCVAVLSQVNLWAAPVEKPSLTATRARVSRLVH
eukprot:15457007-Alexandrium_andersonii.AAC.1